MDHIILCRVYRYTVYTIIHVHGRGIICTSVGNAAADGLKSVNDNIDGSSPAVLCIVLLLCTAAQYNEMG